MVEYKWISNGCPKTGCDNFIDEQAAADACAFFKTFDSYAPTPAVLLSTLAEKLGVKSITLKDESARFGMNAFKVLGAAYAMSRCIAERFGKKMLTYDEMISEQLKSKIGNVTFYAATDGNHGRAVAWTAAKLGCRAIIYLPAGSSDERLQNILATGAKSEILDMNYDDTVRYAIKQAELNNGIMIQDTAWAGYEKIPRYIMEGYSVIAAEYIAQIGKIPTHIILQAGVGAFAGAIQGFFTSYCEKRGIAAPVVIIAEPSAADCYYKSIKAGDGKIHFVGGKMHTLMAGLACGEPNPLGFEIIRENSSFFASCEDSVAAGGMRTLAAPFGDDPKVVSGESGAIGIGLLVKLASDGSGLKEATKIDENSEILCVSTEGATDKNCYDNIVLRGANSL